jgi:hypothetical protein
MIGDAVTLYRRVLNTTRDCDVVALSGKKNFKKTDQ